MWASGPQPGAARPPPPGYCVPGPGVAQGWGPGPGLWERIRGPVLLPLSVNLIKGIPGMTGPCVLRGGPACGMHPHAAEPTAGAEGLQDGVWGAWHCSCPQGPPSVISALAACSGAPTLPSVAPARNCLSLSRSPAGPWGLLVFLPGPWRGPCPQLLTRLGLSPLPSPPLLPPTSWVRQGYLFL